MAMIGKKKYYIQMLSPLVTSDSQGGGTLSYSSLAYVWAEKKELSFSKELVYAGIKYFVAVEFTIRNESSISITADCKITYDSEDYYIYSIVKDEDKIKILAYR